MHNSQASMRASRADMRIEIVKRELNQGALSGFDSAITDKAALLIIAALDSYDEHVEAEAYRRGFEAGEQNAALLRARREADCLCPWHFQRDQPTDPCPDCGAEPPRG